MDCLMTRILLWCKPIQARKEKNEQVRASNEIKNDKPRNNENTCMEKLATGVKYEIILFEYFFHRTCISWHNSSIDLYKKSPTVICLQFNGVVDFLLSITLSFFSQSDRSCHHPREVNRGHHGWKWKNRYFRRALPRLPECVNSLWRFSRRDRACHYLISKLQSPLRWALKKRNDPCIEEIFSQNRSWVMQVPQLVWRHEEASLSPLLFSDEKQAAINNSLIFWSDSLHR